MNLFGKKQNTVTLTKAMPQLMNLPTQSLIKLSNSSKAEETVEFYLIDTRSVRIFEEKEVFALSELEPLGTRMNAYGMMGYADMQTVTYTNGKETIRCLSSVYTGDNKYISEYYGLKKGDPLFKRNEETKEVTFYPQFFRAIGLIGRRLLQIQAPVAWHQERNTRIDPEIQSVWSPEWK